jgi:hypothetical protein
MGHLVVTHRTGGRRPCSPDLPSGQSAEGNLTSVGTVKSTGIVGSVAASVVSGRLPVFDRMRHGMIGHQQRQSIVQGELSVHTSSTHKEAELTGCMIWLLIASNTIAKFRPRTNDGSAIRSSPNTRSGTVNKRPRIDRGIISPYLQGQQVKA